MSLKELRLKQGLSQEKLADLTGLSTRTIQRIEKENKASLESINLLSNALDVPLKTIKEALNTQNQMKILQEKQGETTQWNTLIIVNIILFAVNMLTNPNYPWFIYPLLGWSIPKLYRHYQRNKAVVNVN